jgi:DUF1680 family protein
MYVTGGIGTSGSNEGFTTHYDLPNETAYAETCAGIGLVLWAHRMAMLHGTDAALYMDIAERTLYNAVMSGVSLDGDAFFYDNPLSSAGGHHRREWFGCACCPPNVLRLFSQLGGYFYATSGDDVVINMYNSGTATVTSVIAAPRTRPRKGNTRCSCHACFVAARPAWSSSVPVLVRQFRRPSRVALSGSSMIAIC